MNSLTVFMIDDDMDDQEIFLEAINAIDPSIHCVQNSDATLALTLLQNRAHRPDFIFVDLNMPVMNGFEFLEIMKSTKKLSHIPIVMYTTSNDNSQKEKAKKLGAMSFITKPSNIKTLKAELESILMVTQDA